MQILIINTGGTISSTQTEKGVAPIQGGLKAALKAIPELSHPDMPAYNLIEFDPLLDSSNISVEEWNRLGELIQADYDKYDGFVILHGTDTMAYTASALSFMCEGLTKPIIITGSQLPLSTIRTDAKDNLITALLLATSKKLNEVLIYFNQRLLRGNRSQKVSTHHFNAFASPNFPSLAHCGTQIEWRDDLLLQTPESAFTCHRIDSLPIANFKLFPGMDLSILNYLLAFPLAGLVLETYGLGNANTQADFLNVLHEASDKGVIIINCSQCHHGKVNMHTYETGKTLALMGLVDGGDMTPECAHTKLLYLLTTEKDKNQIKTLMETNLRGERS